MIIMLLLPIEILLIIYLFKKIEHEPTSDKEVKELKFEIELLKARVKNLEKEKRE